MKIAGAIRYAAVKTAGHYANVTCPLITYQPGLSDAVKQLRDHEKRKRGKSL